MILQRKSLLRIFRHLVSKNYQGYAGCPQYLQRGRVQWCRHCSTTNRYPVTHIPRTQLKNDKGDSLPDIVAINPTLIKISKRSRLVGEGCLSVGENYGAVRRATHATIRAYDEFGKEFERGASGLLAQVFQHEVDHLDGILFIDKAENVWHKDDEHAQKLHEAQNS